MEIDNKADKKKKKKIVLPTVTDPSQKIKLKKLSLESTQFVSGWVFFFFFFWGKQVENASKFCTNGCFLLKFFFKMWIIFQPANPNIQKFSIWAQHNFFFCLRAMKPVLKHVF